MGNNIPMLQDVKSWLGKCFAMKDIGEVTYIIGIKIYHDRSRRLNGLSQNAYIDKILKWFTIDASKSGSLPMKPNVDLSKTLGPSTPAEVKRMKGVTYAWVVGESHLTAMKNILKYLRNTKDTFHVYGGDSTTELSVTCYNDIGWETDRDDIQSQVGYVFVMNGGAVDWKSSKQSTTVLSSIEVEYIATFIATMKEIWIRKFIYGLGVVPNLYDSWKSQMELYMQNKEHKRMILESVKHGPLIWPTIEENRVTRTKKYDELSATEKIQADCDLKATNIILQGLPSDIYSLVNHHRVTKDLWERI
uniref:Retrotransposon protein, putative, Ty1-copia subclass n=1 Tax=Tanacetum cinerariifolium TaxID=118510 RepID=A0A6L2NZR9_TANCI|nr:hypothetical protein [Tanacetum cinerariifolium]